MKKEEKEFVYILGRGRIGLWGPSGVQSALGVGCVLRSTSTYARKMVSTVRSMKMLVDVGRRDCPLKTLKSSSPRRR